MVESPTTIETDFEVSCHKAMQSSMEKQTTKFEAGLGLIKQRENYKSSKLRVCHKSMIMEHDNNLV